MKTYPFTFILFISIVFNALSQEQNTSILSSEIDDPDIVKLIENNISKFPNNTQLSIAIVNGGKTNYIGVTRKNDTLKTLENKNNVFEIGSISKVFTSVLFSHLIIEDKVSLTENLGNVFDFDLKSGNDIQLFQLANHTSGLPRLPENIMLLISLNQNNPYKFYTPKLLEIYLKEQVTLENPIGKKNTYSNLGAGLLGYVLTLKSNSSYEELLQNYIFNPLSMNSSTSDLKNVEDALLIKGLNNEGETISNWDFTDALVGAGGIKSSVSDLEKFLRKNFDDDTVYNLPQQSTFKINNNLKIGLGWHISNTKSSETYWHNGGTAGYRSCLAFDKNTKKGIIILSNVSAMNPESAKIDTLCFQLLKRLSNP